MRRPYVIALSVGASVLAGVCLSWPYWLLSIGNNPFLPAGIYRCNIHRDGAAWTRDCIAGADALILREQRLQTGAHIESWFLGGVYEYRRTFSAEDGRVETFVRELADCWRKRDADGRHPPIGKTGVSCDCND